jgi:hypothetical protein
MLERRVGRCAPDLQPLDPFTIGSWLAVDWALGASGGTLRAEGIRGHGGWGG